MKNKLMLIIIAIIIFVPSNSLGYSDIDNHWAKVYIDNMKNAGVLDQFNGSEILPDKKINRAECAELISDFLQKYYGYNPMYDYNNYKFRDLPDVESSTAKIRALNKLSYYSFFTSSNPDISHMVPNKVIEGYPDGSFKPYELVTRAEFAKMLVSALDCLGYLQLGNSGFYYSDVREINHWGTKYIDICYGIEVMNGYHSYIVHDFIKYIEFQPDGNITRAEAIKMIASARNRPYIGMPGESQLFSSTRFDWDNRLYFYD